MISRLESLTGKDAMTDIYQVATTAIIHEVLDDEVIIANLDTGIYYSLRGAGVLMWQLLINQVALPEIIAWLLKKYPHLNSRDCLVWSKQFVDKLLIEDLLIATSLMSEKKSAHFFETLICPSVFSKPCLEKYEEMKNLLMLDPIHEVDAQGWPKSNEREK